VNRDYTVAVYSNPGYDVTDIDGKMNMKHVTVGGSQDYSAFNQEESQQ